MRAFIILSLFTLSYGEYKMCDWPNDQKCPMQAAIFEVLTSESSIQAQIDLLMGDVCPVVTTLTPEECYERFPEFWRSAGIFLWNAYFGAPFCSELAECPSMVRQDSMTCDLCVTDLNDTIDYMIAEIDFIAEYMAGEAFCYSGEFADAGEEEKCATSIRGLLPLSLLSIPDICRVGFPKLCNSVFSVCDV
jgi:hypothetical protein